MILRFSKYSFVAAGSAVSDWVAFGTLSLFGASPLFAQGTARIIGGLFSFLSNRHWSFGTNEMTSKTIQGRRFLLLYCVSYGLSLALFYMMTETLRINLILAKVSVDAVFFVFNFMVMWGYVYQKRSGFTHWFKTTFQQFW